jgi:hypothetical protein
MAGSMRMRIISCLALAIMATCAMAFKDTVKGAERLYTQPDPSQPGGLKGSIDGPGDWNLEGVYALPPDQPRHVYKAKLVPATKKFSFSGLPAGTYDLVVIFDKGAFEGLQLVDRRAGDTLTREDQIKIDQTFSKSEKFFPVKLIHRMAGTTGRGNYANCFVTMVQTKTNYGYASMTKAAAGRARLVYKRYTFKDVGPGWQASKVRGIHDTFAPKGYETPKVSFSEDLQRNRVSDHVKDLGKISLK